MGVGKNKILGRIIQYENWYISTWKHFSRSISKTRELLNGMFCNLSGQQVSNGWASSPLLPNSNFSKLRHCTLQLTFCLPSLLLLSPHIFCWILDFFSSVLSHHFYFSLWGLTLRVIHAGSWGKMELGCLQWPSEYRVEKSLVVAVIVVPQSNA